MPLTIRQLLKLKYRALLSYSNLRLKLKIFIKSTLINKLPTGMYAEGIGVTMRVMKVRWNEPKISIT